MATAKKPYKPQLIDGYEWDEVSSSLNKMIRRGKEYEACFFAYVFHQSGYGLYLWRRLALISAEDIGSANNDIQVLVNALSNNWLLIHKQSKEPSWAKLALIFQCVVAMCRSPKSREIDNLRNLIGHEYESLGKRLEIEEVSLDSHTQRGRKVWGKFGDYKDGKEAQRLQEWYSNWCVVEPEAFKGKYLDKLKDVEAQLIKMNEEKSEK